MFRALWGREGVRNSKSFAEADVTCESSLAFMLRGGGGGGEVRAASDDDDDLLLLAK